MTTTNPITLFILNNLVLIAYLLILGVFGMWAFIKFSKYYVLKEVCLAETKGDRRPRLIGRQILFVKSSSKLAPSSLRKDSGIKAYMLVQEGLPYFGQKKRIAIPNNILVKKTPNRTYLINAKGIKHDYERGFQIPFNEYVKANSPSEEVFYNEIDRKLIETDTEVTKAVACSHKSKEWHNMYNSIPIDVETPREKEQGIIGIKSSQGDEKETKKRARKNIERIKSKFSEKDAMDELGGAEL